jgi:hypothetical protein
MSSCSKGNNIFQEAIDHCRWKSVLHNTLKNIVIKNFQNKTFEQIILDVYNICVNIEGIGMLTIYDITSAICRYYKINIDKVFIIGNGPKRAIKLLNIKPKLYKIEDKIKINYVDINEIINAFDECNFELDDIIRNCKNGDTIESFICNWQKTK